MVYFGGLIKMSLTQHSCLKMSQTVNCSKTLRKTSPEKAVVFLWITVSNYKRISPKDARGICILSACMLTCSILCIRKYHKDVKTVLQEALEIHQGLQGS